MRTKKLSANLAAAALLIFASAALHAADYPVGNLLIARPWSRPTPPSASVGAVYLSITNRGAQADRLLALSTPIADRTQIHESRMVNGMLAMQPLAAVDCPPHATVKIEPGGLHIMLIGLGRPLAAGEDFPLTLRFERAGEVTIHVHVGEPE